MKPSKTKLSQKAVNKIESICELGCTQVNELLNKADDDSEIEALSDFNKDEVKQIIDKLSEIMSVYDNDDR